MDLLRLTLVTIQNVNKLLGESTRPLLARVADDPQVFWSVARAVIVIAAT